MAKRKAQEADEDEGRTLNSVEMRQEYKADHPEEPDHPAAREGVVLLDGRTLSAGEQPAKAPAGGEGKSSVEELAAPDAAEKVARMTSKEKLQAIAENDSRVTVQEAARQRLTELES